jgi:hypothetical protein
MESPVLAIISELDVAAMPISTIVLAPKREYEPCFCLLVRTAGLEPARACAQRILSLCRCVDLTDDFGAMSHLCRNLCRDNRGLKPFHRLSIAVCILEQVPV